MSEIEKLSPSKKTQFRSKTKQKQLTSTMNTPRQKTIPFFYNYVKELPLQTSQDIVLMIKNFEPIHTEFVSNLQNLKLYKSQLASVFEENWSDFMQFLKSVVIKMNRRADKIAEQKQRKISELLNMNRDLQAKQQGWKDRIQKLQNLRQMEKAQLTMADTELEVVNKEMGEIYTILHQDMGKIMSYLTALEAKKAKQNQAGSTEIYTSLNSLSIVLNNMESEQRETNTTLTTMRQLIKAMTRKTNATTGTQVDQSELQTQAGKIFNTGDQQKSELPFETADGSSVNVTGKHPQNHLIDKLKEKEKVFAPQKFKMEKHAQKPWALTPTLLVFLQNMSKQNESGKVLPWEYMKQLIHEIYDERMKYEQQMIAGCIGNGMLFDEFVVFWFLNRYKIRRLAEVKLLEFIISIKYYCKFWLKAEMFCWLMDVMRYMPMAGDPQAYPYKFDYNTQNFFFAIYSKLLNFQIIEDDGTSYIATKSVKKLMRAALFFTDEMSRSRLFVKLDKDLRVFEKVEYCDFDFALFLFLDEYFAVKKKCSAVINRAFSKKYDQIQGFFSLDEMLDLFNELGPIYRAGSQFSQKYPIDSRLQVCKLYLYSITSGKNGYDIHSNHFLNACQRFGFDAPYPFLHACWKGRHKERQATSLMLPVQKEGESDEFKKVSAQQKSRSSSVLEFTPQALPQKPAANGTLMSLNSERIDVGAKIFSQHFSILRQLKSYVDIFNNTLRNEKDMQNLWKQFGMISKVLSKGCEFLKFPLMTKGS